MRSVVPDVNVLAEQLRADTIVQKRALVENRHAAEIPEHEADYIERGRGLEYNGVPPRWDFPRMAGFDRLAGRRLRQSYCVKVPHVGRIQFLPARRIVGQHGDGNLRQRLAMPFGE